MQERDSKLARVLSWSTHHAPELALFAIGVLLRVTMRWSYDPTWSFDSGQHWKVVEWILERHRIPHPSEMLMAQHPPLSYALAAALTSLGVSRANVVWLPIGCGTLRLALTWLGLELYLPSSRWARVSALALAAVLPASIHIDGMIYTEAVSALWTTAAMVVVPFTFRPGARSTWWPILTGILLGLAMLTKFSTIVVIASVVTGALAAALATRGTWGSRAAVLAPCALAIAMCVSVCGWYYVRNVRTAGRPFLTSFELSQRYQIEPYQKLSYWRRRSRWYFVRWTSSIYEYPYHPSGITGKRCFFPVAMASTFVDYWNFSFSGIDPTDPGPIRLENSRPLTPRVLVASQYAVVGGTVIFAATCVAWLVAMRELLQRRDWGRITLLLIPLFMLAGAMHFAVKYPADHWGVVKGAYMQFAAAPLTALFGCAVGWSQQKRARWPILGTLLVALWFVAAYSVYCRTRIPLLPLGAA